MYNEVGGNLELYDMSEDRTELHDLAEANRSKAEELASLYELWAERNGVMPWPIQLHKWDPSIRSRHNHCV